MIAANVNGNYNEITQVFAGGDVQKEIIKIWAADESKWVYEAVGEISGVLPLRFTSDGTPLIEYKIYGYVTGGIGTPTKNLFNKNAIEYPAYIRANGTINTTSGASGYAISDYIPVSADSYVAHGLQSRGNLPHIAVYDENQELVRTVQIVSNEDLNLTIASNEKYIRLSVRMAGDEYQTAMFTRGATAPETFVPFGYKLDISTSDGTSITTTPVYIGDDPLDEDEYVDYQAGKIYRMINGVLTPTDPPVPLPALPTCEGTTVIDYDDVPAPSSVEIKYKKGW